MALIYVRLSVILPTSGVAHTVEKTVESIVHSLEDDCELIVVQNGPRADFQSLEKYANSGPVFKMFHESCPSLLAGRHRGVAESASELLVFVDDDVIVTRDWANAIIDGFDDQTISAIGGPCSPRYASAPPTWLSQFWHESEQGIRSCGYLSLIDAGSLRRDIDPMYIWGLNFAIRKKTLLDLDGFNPDGVPWQKRRFRGDGESGLSRKLQAAGLRAVYEPKAEVTHLVPINRLTIEYFERRALLQGISNSYTDIRAKHHVESTNSPQSPPFWRRIGSKAKCYLSRCRSPIEKRRTIEAYDCGYNYHQAEIASDPQLLQWVTRKHYWDYEYPTTG